MGFNQGENWHHQIPNNSNQIIQIINGGSVLSSGCQCETQPNYNNKNNSNNNNKKKLGPLRFQVDSLWVLSTQRRRRRRRRVNVTSDSSQSAANLHKFIHDGLFRRFSVEVESSPVKQPIKQTYRSPQHQINGGNDHFSTDLNGASRVVPTTRLRAEK